MNGETLENFTISTLELNKIKQYLSELAVSEPGKHKINEIQPLKDKGSIEKCLKLSMEFKGLLQVENYFPIHGLDDVVSLINRNKMGFLSPVEALRIKENLEIAKNIKSFITHRKENYPELSSLAKNLKPLEELIDLIEKSVDDTGTVKDTANKNLKRIRKQLSEKSNFLKKSLNKILAQLSKADYTRDDIITIKDGRYVIPIKEGYKKKVQGIIHHESASGETIYIEPLEILEQNNYISKLKIDEEREIKKILTYITGELFGSISEIESNQELLAILDDHFARGQFALRVEGFAPDIIDERKFSIKEGKHPLLLLKHDDKSKVVPLNLKLGEEFKVLLITGPNAGGKTVALKTIGLLSLMVQCGIPVPVDPDSYFPVSKRIIADIGDTQSIEMDLSTFSAHIQTIMIILKNLSKDDLILIDEIGTGTDPEEGSSLAISILEKLNESGCLSVTTTHHGKLKSFAFDNEGIENASMSFDEESLQPTYKLKVGLPGSSYAFEISKKLGLPQEIIDRSINYLGKKEFKLENIIRDMEEKVKVYERELGEISVKKTELDSLRKLYEERQNHLDKNSNKLIREAVEESEEIVKKANALVEKTIKEVRESQASRESVKKSKKDIQEFKEKIASRRKKLVADEKEERETHYQFSVNQEVSLKGFNKPGVIISINQNAQKAKIQLDNITMDIDINRLVPFQGEEKKIAKSKTTVIQVSDRLDLRGLYAYDALQVLDSYIDDAYAGGLDEVTIIHGKGKGILREEVRKFLKKDSRISNFRSGAWNEGDIGVTIVQMKI